MFTTSALETTRMQTLFTDYRDRKFMKTANRLVLLNRNTAGLNKDFRKTAPKITQNRITANPYAPLRKMNVKKRKKNL